VQRNVIFLTSRADVRKAARKAALQAQHTRQNEFYASLICTSECSPLSLHTQKLLCVKAVQERLLVDTDLTG
jgi:hypothetical protein